MTNERKRYSKRRESLLWAEVDRAITAARIEVLRGRLNVISPSEQEAALWKLLGNLPDKVVDAYKRKLTT